MRADFYKENRDNFAAKMEPGSLALFFSGELQRKSSDDDYPWYPSRNFIYLTGIEQHDSVLAIYKYPEQPENGAGLRILTGNKKRSVSSHEHLSE